ncbi:MAG: hypothetical protein KFB93_00450 [Simkaniaceae bacterium]|nr:MAG: hypothetical protein KFB93_00450 [Simkaniaceae bacterium]
MKEVILGFLTAASIGAFASVKEEYVPCEKTYIDPEVVDLHEKKIKISSSGEVYQTSAIYSDANGLFYKDYLDAHEHNVAVHECDRTLIAQTDTQLDPFGNQNTSDNMSLYTDELLAQEQNAKQVVQYQPPLVKKEAWPYTNKRR